MQGFEEKEKKYAAQNEPERKTCQTHALTTTPQRRRFRLVKVSYLTRAKEKKAADSKYMDTLCENAAHQLPPELG